MRAQRSRGGVDEDHPPRPGQALSGRASVHVVLLGLGRIAFPCDPYRFQARSIVLQLWERHNKQYQRRS